MSGFVVMAKPVGSRCNMRCAYCYYLEKGRFSRHEKQTRMSYSLLEKLIRQTIESSQGPVVSFIWHGGEPTLAGLEFYRKAVELQRKHLPRGWQAWNNLQTNGLLLNDAWCRFLKENHFDVGVSTDGSQAVHDANRHDLGGGPTWERTRKAIRRLRSFGVEPDLLCTVNHASVADPLGVYRGLRDTGSGWVQFIPIVVRLSDGGFSSQSVTPEDYGSFLWAVFQEWVTKDLGKLDVQLFAEMARILAGGEASLCWMAPTCGQVLICEEDGSVYSCDHFVDEAHRLGDLARGRLNLLADSGFQRQFGRSKRDALTAECRRCPHIRLCNGGCLKDRFGLSEDGEEGQYILCKGLKSFFDRAVPVLRRVMELSAQGTPTHAIMASISAELEGAAPGKEKVGEAP